MLVPGDASQRVYINRTFELVRGVGEANTSRCRHGTPYTADPRRLAPRRRARSLPPSQDPTVFLGCITEGRARYLGRSVLPDGIASCGPRSWPALLPTGRARPSRDRGGGGGGGGGGAGRLVVACIDDTRCRYPPASFFRERLVEYAIVVGDIATDGRHKNDPVVDPLYECPLPLRWSGSGRSRRSQAVGGLTPRLSRISRARRCRSGPPTSSARDADTGQRLIALTDRSITAGVADYSFRPSDSGTCR